MTLDSKVVPHIALNSVLYIDLLDDLLVSFDRERDM